MQVRRVVTCFLYSKGKILILRRSDRVRTYTGKWAGISGYVENGIEEQAYKEIEEETGLRRNEVELINSGSPLKVIDNELDIKWIVYPFLFKIFDFSNIRLDWEHIESRWITPKDLVHYDVVPKLIEAFSKIRLKKR